jgi:hypothetical protein
MGPPFLFKSPKISLKRVQSFGGFTPAAARLSAAVFSRLELVLAPALASALEGIADPSQDVAQGPKRARADLRTISSGSSFVLNCSNDRSEYGSASATGDHL